jgi:hypothetical protein
MAPKAARRTPRAPLLLFAGKFHFNLLSYTDEHLDFP